MNVFIPGVLLMGVLFTAARRLAVRGAVDHG